VKYRDSAVSCAKTAEPIDMPFRMWTRLSPRKHVFDGGAHWRHVVNTTEIGLNHPYAAAIRPYIKMVDHLFFCAIYSTCSRRRP